MPPPGDAAPRRLVYFNAGFATQTRLRRILALAGHELRPGLPGPRPDEGIVVWGRSPYAARGEAAAARLNLPLLRIEDAFLRSIHPGRIDRGGPLGLLLDPIGVHFDSATPSTLERLLATHPLDDAHLLTRARDGIARLAASDLSKYNAHDPSLPAPPPGYVLVIDQTRSDASIRHGRATPATFADMLITARLDHPNARIVIKTHPETAAGLRPGHFGAADTQTYDGQGPVTLLTAPVSPHALLAGAIAVYTVTSQLGWEAVLAGHRPIVFGQPWYAGWGLTDDRNEVPRRTRRLTKPQIFAAAMILAPLWHDPCRDRLCSFEAALDQLEAEVRAFRDDRTGHVAVGMRLWKRPHLHAMFGQNRPLLFRTDPTRAIALAQRTSRSLLIWGDRLIPGRCSPTDQDRQTAHDRTASPDFATGPIPRQGSAPVPHPAPQAAPPDLAPPLRRVEDGFLRSRGLGAALVPPLSLILDDLGLHHDPAGPSRLETLILQPPPPGGRDRADRLIARIVAAGVTKYNLGQPVQPHPVAQAAMTPGTPHATPPSRILVPGQVEDDASVRLGAGSVRTNLALLRAVREANPDAYILWKPHPDVEAGLRPGRVDPADLANLADETATRADPATLFARVDEVWTMTSLLGFEALLRGLRVICLGAPFYAGWGLTIDLGPVPLRRSRAPDGHPLPRPDLTALAHAALIAYPRYFDPVSRRPCPPEVALDRLTDATLPSASRWNRLLAKAQGAVATLAPRWR